jgi:ribose transport system permease protein
VKKRILIDANFRMKHGHTLIIYIFLIALMLFISIFNKYFLTLGNFKNLLRSSFPLLLIGFGQTLIILTGGIDLSLGAITSLCNVTCVLLMDADSQWGFVLPIIAAITVGIVCGAINGLAVTKGRLAPIIVTIATTAVFDGLALLSMPNPGGSVHRGFAKFVTNSVNGTFPLLLFLLVLFLIRRMTNNTSYGKSLRAIGGNQSAAYSTGISVDRVKIIAYCLAGLLSAIAGIFLTAQMNSADASVGKNFSMNAITAAVVGGSAMTGAVGDPIGTVAGVFIITMINNMLNLFGVSSFYQYVCQGLILIIAISLSAIRKRH